MQPASTTTTTRDQTEGRPRERASATDLSIRVNVNIKSEHGWRNHTTAKHVIEAGRERCAELGDAGGVDTDEGFHAGSEITRLRP